VSATKYLLSILIVAQAEHEFPLTMDEFMEAYPEVAPEQFMLIDTDGDGQVSEEEYESTREAGIIGGEDDI